VRRAAGALVLALGLAAPAAAQCPQPAQVDEVLDVSGSSAVLQTKIAPGDARLRVRATPMFRRDVVRADLRFAYPVPRGTIAFDELVCRIELSVEDAQGAILSRAAIETDDVHLNPNRVPLAYRVTLYLNGGERVRVRVFGNYE
jgi:hypothetical protein